MAKVVAIGVLWLTTLVVVVGSTASTPPTATSAPQAGPTDTPTPRATTTPTGDTSAPVPVPTDSGSNGSGSTELEARSLLSRLAVAAEGSRSGYDRDLFRHWIDADGDGCDTRREVLMEESLDPVSSCSLTGGRWFSPYDGTTTTDPSTFDIDHMVPLAEAWDSGANTWSASRRRDFANDLDYDGSLIAVTASSNRSKSDRDPAEWKPPREVYWCIYAVSWMNIKIRWALTADQAEVGALGQMLGMCQGGQPEATGAPPPPPPPPEPTEAPQPTQGGDCHPSYPDFCIPPPPPDLDCGEVNGSNFTVRHDVADPDPHRFDGDKDGVGCEA